MEEKLATLLLAEDVEDDVFIFKRALKKAGVANPLQVVTDGNEAVAYLAGEGKYADRERFPLPFLILLDLMMPYRDGFEVLDWIRKQRPIANIPVVILTSSAQERDRSQAYKLGARSYLVKPPTAEALADLASSLEPFYIGSRGASPFSRGPAQS